MQVFQNNENNASISFELLLVSHPPDNKELDIAFRGRDGELDLVVCYRDFGIQSTLVVQVGVHLDPSSDKLRDVDAHVGDELQASGRHEGQLVLGSGSKKLMILLFSG